MGFITRLNRRIKEADEFQYFNFKNIETNFDEKGILSFVYDS